MKPHTPKYITLRLAAIAIAASVGATSCGLVFDDLDPCPDSEVGVQFDWSRISLPQYQLPEGLTTFFYPVGTPSYWRFELGSAGGTVTIPEGEYRFFCANNDTRDVIIRDLDNADRALAYSLEGRIDVNTAEMQYADEPPHPDETQPIRRQPDVMYVSRPDEPSYVSPTSGVVTIFPEQFTPVYIIYVDNITNIGSIGTAAVSITGMAAGKYLTTGERLAEPVTMPGALAPYTPDAGVSGSDSSDSGSQGPAGLSGYFISFGPAPGCDQHMLCVYLRLRNGENRIYRFDVSETVNNTVGKNISTIRVGGIELPDVGGQNPDIGGMQVGIDGWITTDISIGN